ncbi:MAG: flagellar basal body-associated protein FliL [Amphiplicatus sp.]
MADTDEEPPEIEEKKKSPMKAIVFGAAGVVAMGAAATGAAYFLAPASRDCAVEASKPAEKGGHASSRGSAESVAFVNIEPLVVTLGPGASSRYLKISISLETTQGNEKSLTDLTPRIRDTLNGYLRAVEEDDLIQPAGMARLRAQMLRRLQLITPADSIHDVLITDFVLT